MNSISALADGGTGQATAAVWREHLKAGRLSLQNGYLEEPRPQRLLAAHTRLVDEVLHGIWQELKLPREAAMVAVGGYGRGELYPASDVDILLLLPDGADPNLLGAMEPLVSLLWDVGLEIGHAVRTTGECVAEARKDITVQTNLLECRLVAGNRHLYESFHERLNSVLDPAGFYEAKLLEQQQRHARYHDTAYNLEPNIKENPGGLRDLHLIIWIARSMGLGRRWTELARQDLITADEVRQLKHHATILQDLRIRLHYLAKRREDRLLFDFQRELAGQLDLHDKGGRMASELLMQRYYRTAKAVMLLNEILMRNLRLHAIPPIPGAPVLFNERFAARNNLLLVRDEKLFEKEPGTILEAFLMMERHPDLAGMTAVTLRALWRAVPRIDAAFRRDPRNRVLFLELIREPHGITHEFRRMSKYGVLGRYIPSFGRIIGQMQHDLFHVYTVDEHILMVLRNVRRFTVPEFAHEFPLCSRLISSFERPEVLYLAALFHDIAKGRGGDHSTLGARDARRFCRLHGLPEEDTDMVGWLVENHLTMSQTAQKRDLSDPDVIRGFARKVRDMRHLTALYLLTVADIRGTSPKVWNAWKGKLLEDLYRLARLRLQGSEGNQESFLEERQEEALRIFRLYALSDDAHGALWKNFDDSYFLRHDAQEIAWHTRCLFHRHDTGKPVVRARLSPHGAGIQVLIYTPDQECLFARICGFFERNHYNIAEAKIYTTRHGHALDTFVVLAEGVGDVHYRDLLSFVEYELANTLARQEPLTAPATGRLSRQLKHFPMEPQVNIRPDDKGLYYILSVVAGDRPGLLSRIAQILVKHGFSLHNAKITTLGQRAEDTFLINGPGLDDAKTQLLLERDLMDALRT